MDQNTFRTKNGSCQVTDKEIIITREGAAGRLATLLFGESAARLLGIYLAVGVVLFGNAVLAFNEGDWLLGLVLLCAAVLLVRGVIRNRTVSATQRILLSEIRLIHNSPPLTGFRPHFIVHFTRKGRDLQRFIILPSPARGGKEEYQKALPLMERIHHQSK